jgi:hypothetical protein
MAFWRNILNAIFPPHEEKNEPPLKTGDTFPVDSRGELIKQVIERKERLWGQGDRVFNPQRSARNVVQGIGGHKPNIALLRWAANATDDQLVGAASSRDIDYGFLFYK